MNFRTQLQTAALKATGVLTIPRLSVDSELLDGGTVPANPDEQLQILKVCSCYDSTPRRVRIFRGTRQSWLRRGHLLSRN